MEPSERITVRLNSETAAALKILVDRGEFESLSDAVRKAMEDFIAVRLTSEEISKIVSDIDIEDDSSVIGKSDVEAMNRSIREAVTGFVRTKMDEDDSDTQNVEKKKIR